MSAQKFNGRTSHPLFVTTCFERLRERKITAEDLYQSKLCREAEPEAPDGSWYKDFGSFKVRGGARDSS